jgi:signal transduction histidine kinase
MEAEAEILVVEDEAPIRAVWERFLARWGYRADIAENGKAGLDRARQHRYKLVITDLTMPVMTGQELVHTLKAEQPDTEVIVMTGQGTIEIAVEMMKAGAYDFVTKPINFTSAEFIIKKCLEKVQAREENQRLRAINRDLEELNQIKEKFIAITSHELRTPVSVIGNVVEALAALSGGGDEEALLRMARTASSQLREIVAQMHELSQLKSSQIELQLARFPFRDVCQEVIEECELAVRDRGHRLHCEVSDGLSVLADRAKIKKVLRELIQNAIKFTPDGGEIRIEAGLAPANGFAFTVRDSGIGIPEGERDKIFQMFYEVSDPLHHHTSKSAFQGGGMGVGLSIVQDIVKAHRGQVRVNNTPGGGTCFTVTLPEQSSQPAA